MLAQSILAWDMPYWKGDNINIRRYSDKKSPSQKPRDHFKRTCRWWHTLSLENEQFNLFRWRRAAYDSGGGITRIGIVKIPQYTNLLYICYKIQNFCIPDMNTCTCTCPLSHPFITPHFGTPLYFSLPRGFSTWIRQQCKANNQETSFLIFMYIICTKSALVY